MDIEKFDLPPGTLVRICEESEAQYQHGWRLIAIVPWKGRVAYDEEKRDERGSYLRMEKVWVDTESVRYVLAQDVNETVEKALREASVAQEDLRSARGKLEDATDALEREKKVSAKATTDFEHANYFLIEKGQQLQAAEASKQKLEKDISKLRDALGELRMKEILGSK
jgi:hypothetical protein